MKAITFAECDAIVHLGAIPGSSELQPPYEQKELGPAVGGRNSKWFMEEDTTMKVNTMGMFYVAAAISAASKVQMISFGPFDAVGTTMGTFGAQNLGAGKLERIDQGLKKSVLMVVVYSVAALGILYFVGQYLIMIFIDPSETAIIAQAKQFMLTSAVFYIPLAMICIFRTLIQSLGYSRVAMFAGVFEMVARIFIARVIIPQFGFTGVCFGNPAAWVMADVFLIPAYFTIRKKLDTQIPPIQKISEE